MQEALSNNFDRQPEVQSSQESQEKTPEQKKLEEFKSELDNIRGSKEFVGRMENTLRTRLLQEGDPQDKEYRELALKVKNYQAEIQALTGKEGEIQTEIAKLLGEVNEEIKKLSEGEINKLKNISNNEFLSVPDERRLQYVTEGNIDSADVSSGKVTEITTSFTYEGHFNKELYIMTTAGQVLPKEVGEVESGGKTYTRTGLDGEFFSGSSRLLIHEGTDVKIGDLRTPEEILKIEEGISEKLDEYPEEVRDIASEALERNIDPELAILVLKDQGESGNRKVLIEEFFTDFDRNRAEIGAIDLKDGKYDDKLAITIFRLYSPEWKELAKDYGIDELSIKRIEKELNEKLIGIDLENLAPGVNGLLDFIAARESNGNYNAIYGNAEQSNIDFTSMTIREVLNNQRDRINRGQQSATGKYQFIYKTLKSTCLKHGVDIDTQKFSPEFQDKLAIMKLKERGLDSYMSGSMSRDQFQVSLAKEWASLPKDESGRSYYAGDGLNKSHYSNEQVDYVLDNLKKVA